MSNLNSINNKTEMNQEFEKIHNEIKKIWIEINKFKERYLLEDDSFKKMIKEFREEIHLE